MTEFEEKLLAAINRVGKALEDQTQFMRERAAKEDAEDFKESLGGDSELLTEALHKVERRFGIEIHPNPDDSDPEVKPV